MTFHDGQPPSLSDSVGVPSLLQGTSWRLRRPATIMLVTWTSPRSPWLSHCDMGGDDDDENEDNRRAVQSTPLAG